MDTLKIGDVVWLRGRIVVLHEQGEHHTGRIELIDHPEAYPQAVSGVDLRITPKAAEGTPPTK